MIFTDEMKIKQPSDLAVVFIITQLSGMAVPEKLSILHKFILENSLK